MKALSFLFSASLLLFSVGAFASSPAEQALDGFYKRVNSFESHFEQVQLDEEGGVVQKASGIFLLARPARFRWEYDTPYKQIIVSDGKAFRFYDVDLAQVTVRDVNDSLRATPALLLSGGAALDEEFKISSLGEHDKLQWVRLVPRGAEGDFEAIRIGLNGEVPARMELDDKLGQTTIISFSQVHTNVNIAAQRFTIKIPDDVEIVDGRKAAQTP